ncbi:acyl-homoserine-lactone synthase [Acidocella facilis]|uniref:acyl-homoserine-lactone synthase n=1 Tax=Acidocella facilis TaxID=525 RepID=UPI001F20A4AC|nr:acyl-homoserine-lactone synthase [Acidocella facilis]
MIAILTNADRDTHHHVFDQMFRGRAVVFHEMYDQDVSISDGREVDRYDMAGDPVYLVLTDNSGDVAGSLRLLPTVGDTILQNEFRDHFDAPVDFRSPTAWECTKFCIHPRNSTSDIKLRRAVAYELLIKLCALALKSGIEHIISVHETRMIEIYRCIGWEPDQLARAHGNLDGLAVGLWEVSETHLREMRNRASADLFQGLVT